MSLVRTLAYAFLLGFFAYLTINDLLAFWRFVLLASLCGISYTVEGMEAGWPKEAIETLTVVGWLFFWLVLFWAPGFP